MELEALFAHSRHLRAVHRLAQQEIAAAFARQQQGRGDGPAEDAFDELAFFMARSECADARYLQLLGHIATQLISQAAG
ncbi:hypothetical protein [Variovorax sp. SRS16]|uniref:hypothetical protein n=1 Tax=Variovorax sp. SRS16 TaxID=282217 RepID=UPI0013A54C59|nr:hypothetical protein [Variovorax sp. SRS16]